MNGNRREHASTEMFLDGQKEGSTQKANARLTLGNCTKDDGHKKHTTKFPGTFWVGKYRQQYTQNIKMLLLAGALLMKKNS